MTVLKQSRRISRVFKFSHGLTWVVELLVLLQMLPLAASQNGTGPQGPQQQGSVAGYKFDKRMAQVMVLIVGVFFALVFLSVYICRRTENRIRGRFDLAVAVNGSGRRLGLVRGLDAATINTFPTFVYSTVKGIKIGKGSLECAVCLNEFGEEETLRLLPRCSHVFHTDCIDAWLASHSTCPVCRANLVPKPGEIPCAVVHIPDPDSESGQPDQRSDAHETQTCVADSQSRDSEAPNVNLVNHTQGINQNRRPSSQSTGFRIAGIFPPSHSTGHSLVQPGENCERFTLRLPDDVRNRLINSTLNRSNSCVAFPRAQSSTRGYRSASGGTERGRNYMFSERFAQ